MEILRGCGELNIRISGRGGRDQWEEFEWFAREAFGMRNPNQADIPPTLNSLEEVFSLMETSTRALLENWPDTEIKIENHRRVLK
jgi:hypothetical protein